MLLSTHQVPALQYCTSELGHNKNLAMYSVDLLFGWNSKLAFVQAYDCM